MELTVRLGLKRRSDSYAKQKTMKKLRKKEQLGHNISYPSSAAAVVFGRRLSARFPCPAGQEIARSPPLRVASYVSANILSSLETVLVFDQFEY